MPSRSLILAVALGSAPIANGQRLMVPHTSPRALVALVDASAGALIDPAWIDVYATATPTPSPNALRAIERVGDEVWVSAAEWVHRYDAITRAYLGSIEFPDIVRSLEEQFVAGLGRRVLATAETDTFVVSMGGLITSSLGMSGAGDTLHVGSGLMLVANRGASRIDLYTDTGEFVRTFAGPTIPTPLGVLSRPRQIVRRFDSPNFLVCGDVRIYEFTPTGEFVLERDFGPFERGVSDTGSGKILVALSSGLALFDTETNMVTNVGGPFFGQGRMVAFYDRADPATLLPEDSFARVECSGSTLPSGGRASLSILGSAVASDRSLTLAVEHLIPDVPVALAVSRRMNRIDLTGDAQLCVHRTEMLLVPSTTPSSPSGRAVFPILSSQAQLIPVGPGSSFVAQAIFRSREGVSVSDAINVQMAVD